MGKEEIIFSLEVPGEEMYFLELPRRLIRAILFPFQFRKVLYFFISSAVGKDVVFLFTRHKVELVGGIGPTVGKVMYLDHD